MTGFTLISFLRNRIKGKRWDSFHSPYLFRLFSYMINDGEALEAFNRIEVLRRKWQKDETMIERNDFGAGSIHSEKKVSEKISTIANRSLSYPFQCRCLARLLQLENPGRILELGTSLGISTAYLQSGAPGAKVITVEGDPQLAKLATHTFDDLGMNQIELIVSTFEDFFENKLDDTKIDVVFLDGNHQSSALIEYYNKLKTRFTLRTIVIIDDIYWSSDMNEGWNKLVNLPEVTQSVDCFQFGVLFFRNEFLNKEHHILRTPLKSVFRK